MLVSAPRLGNNGAGNRTVDADGHRPDASEEVSTVAEPPSAAWAARMDWRSGTLVAAAPGAPRVEWRPPPRPGVLSRRPLRFFEGLDGGFRLIRFAPALTVGLSAIVFTLWTLLIGVVISGLAWAGTGFLSEVFSDPDAAAGFSIVAQFGAFALSISSLSLVHLLTGVGAVAARAAFDSRRMTLRAGWLALRGVRLRLVLVTGLLGLAHLLALAVLLLPALVVAGLGQSTASLVLTGLGLLGWCAFTLYFALRTAFVGCTVAHERRTIRQAFVRSWRLTGSGFWRTLGQLLLGWYLSNQLVSIIITPLVVIAYVLTILAVIIGISSGTGGTVMLLSALAVVAVVVGALTIAATAVLFAYLAGLVSVVFFDRLMRAEGYDLVLLRQAEAEA